MSTNTSSYTICSAPNVYIFVYILIETRIAPLSYHFYQKMPSHLFSRPFSLESYQSRRALLSLHVVTVAILGAAGWLQGALQFFASSPKRL